MYETIRTSPKNHAEPDMRVVFIFTDKTLHLADQDLDARNDRRISAAIKREESDVKGDAGEFTVTHGQQDETLLGVLGLGKESEFNAEKARAAGAGLVKALQRLNIKRAELSMPRQPLQRRLENRTRLW